LLRFPSNGLARALYRRFECRNLWREAIKEAL
jgi:hypothetical protein